MSALIRHFLTALGALTGQLPARLVGLVLAAGLGWTLAQSGLDRLHLLALQRYGNPAAEIVGGWRHMLEESRALSDDEKLKAVNLFFNRHMRFNSDQAVWGVPDYWATPLESLDKRAGDCEDYAIAKYASLVAMGVPTARLRMVYVRARLNGQSLAHMVLAYYAEPGAEPLILDNLRPELLPASQRRDLTPVFSFNTEGLWQGVGQQTAGNPLVRLSIWRELVAKLKAEGFL